MPLYEYECKQCKRHTEKIQKFSDPEITQCPHCGGLLERVVSAPAISFKGGGWFKDGYGNAKPSSSKNEGQGSDVPSVAAAAASNSKDSAPASSAPAAPAPAAPAASSSDKK